MTGPGPPSGTTPRKQTIHQGLTVITGTSFCLFFHFQEPVYSSRTMTDRFSDNGGSHSSPLQGNSTSELVLVKLMAYFDK